MADEARVTTPRLEMRGIGKSFGGVAVLTDVGLVVAPGEVMALLGSNGAGKSTLVKILTGVYTRDAGVVKVDGEEVVFPEPRAAVAAGVRLLPQEISVMPDMTVAENIALGDLPMKREPRPADRRRCGDGGAGACVARPARFRHHRPATARSSGCRSPNSVSSRSPGRSPGMRASS